MAPNPFQWDAPDGPNTPFATGVLIFDLMRIAVIFMCVAITVISVNSISRKAITLGSKSRLIGTMMAFFFFIGGTEFEHIGDYAHWRLYVAFFAGVASSWGLWSYYNYETPGQLKIRDQ